MGADIRDTILTRMILSAALQETETTQVRSKTRPPSQSVAWLSVLIVFIIYVIRLFRLISRYAVNIFFADQWDFNNATLFQRHSLWQMFRWQHGPHRQGVGALFERMVDPLSRWDSRTESFVVGGVIVAVAVFALWLKRRLYGKLSISDVAIPAILLTTAQWQTLFMTQNFAHGPFPLLLVLLYCLSWTSRRQSVRYPLVLFFNFVTIYTGFGIFLGVLTPVLLILDYRASTPQTRLPRMYFLTCILVALVSLGSFFVRYEFQSASGCFSLRPQSPISYWHFMALMFANFFALRNSNLAAELFGTIILTTVLLLLIILITHLLRNNSKLALDDRNRTLIVFALMAFSLLFCVSTAYGRVCRPEASSQSRYAIYLEPAVLGFYFFLLTIHQRTARNLVLSGYLVAVVLASLYRDRAGMEFAWNVKEHWKRCYLQTENIDLCDEVAGYPIYPGPGRSELKEKLEYLKKTRQNLYLDQKLPSP